MFWPSLLELLVGRSLLWLSLMQHIMMPLFFLEALERPRICEWQLGYCCFNPFTVCQKGLKSNFNKISNFIFVKCWIRGLSLLLVLSLAPRDFSPGTPVFPSPQKPTFPNSNSTRNQVDEEPLYGCATCKSLFIYLFIYFYLKYWRRGFIWMATPQDLATDSKLEPEFVRLLHSS